MGRIKIIACAVLAAIGLHLPQADAGRLQPELLQTLATPVAPDRVAVIIRFRDRVDAKTLRSMAQQFRPRRRAEIIMVLRDKSETVQARVREQVDAEGGGNVRQLWMINGLAAKLAPATIMRLATHPEVESISLDAELAPPDEPVAQGGLPQWNLTMVGADALWGMGYTGQGVVVGIMDTGVDVLHPDLGTRWRGGTHGWFDPYGEDTDENPGTQTTPHDPHGHGTQVAGIILGGDAGGSAIGVAPGAQWIAARIYDDSGQGNLSAVHAAFQWMLDPDGDPATDDAVDIVTNAWNLQGTTNICNLEFQDDIDVLRAAAIAVVFSAGNGGPAPATSLSPANNAGTFEVGAVDDARNMAGFSARGPSACDAGLYPQVSAPGVNIRTADLTFNGVIEQAYATVSGTSYAASHVAGVMALLKSAFADATLEQLESALAQSAQDAGIAGPDHDYGWGVVNALAAYQSLAASNSAPVAMDDYAATVRTRTVRINLLANDSDADGTLDPATIHIVTPPRRGTVVDNGDGRVMYGSWLNRAGVDSFTYVVRDNLNAVSNEAVVTIDITRR